MPDLTPDDVARLTQLDASLRAEADRMLAESGLGEIIGRAGYKAVGSYAMHTMTWRDLDFERVQDSPDWEDHWAVGARLARTWWPWRQVCVDSYRDPRDPLEQGLYWGLRVSPPGGGETWKLDLWTARPEEFSSALRDHWRREMTEKKRLHILAIKEAICQLPEYRRSLLSVHIYEAVIDCGIAAEDDFMAWWRRRIDESPPPPPKSLAGD